jgi:2-iminoacetate synthase
MDKSYNVTDEEFVRLVAILRLAVPYTGLILTARETPEIRREVLRFGVSQIDGGTKLELGGYHEKEGHQQDLEKEQFFINDNRTLEEIISELLDNGFVPSFCTSCYRTGRTGEHFMEFSVPGFIKRFCSPNAMLTLAEYLEDYAGPETKIKGYKAIEENLRELSHFHNTDELVSRLQKIKEGQRDLYL